MGISPVVLCDACQFRCKSKYKTKYIKAFKKSRGRNREQIDISYFTVLLLDRRIQIHNCSCIYCYINIGRCTTVLGVSWELSGEGNLFNKINWTSVRIEDVFLIFTQIPELASFWLISTLIHFPLEMFLLFDSKTRPHLSETITNGIMAFLLVIEIVTATVALKKSADHHAKRFYMAQLYEIDDNGH